MQCFSIYNTNKRHLQKRIFHRGLYIPRKLPELRKPKFMSHHENLKPKEPFKEETYISDNCSSQAGFLFTKPGFFLPKWLLQCCFKDLLLKNVRYFIVDSTIYIFSGQQQRLVRLEVTT